TSKELRKQIAVYVRKSRQLLDVLAKEIESLPDNSRITRLEGHDNCFTIRSKDLGANWAPKHHDFKEQYREIVDLLKKTQPHLVIEKLEEIIRAGRIPPDRRAQYTMLH